MAKRKGTVKGKAPANAGSLSDGEAFDLNVSDTSVGSNEPTKAPLKAPTTARGGRAAITAAPVAVGVTQQLEQSKLIITLCATSTTSSILTILTYSFFSCNSSTGE